MRGDVMKSKEFRSNGIVGRAVLIRRVRLGINIDPDPQEVEPE